MIECKYCGQANENKSLCCHFCGGRLPAKRTLYAVNIGPVGTTCGTAVVMDTMWNFIQTNPTGGPSYDPFDDDQEYVGPYPETGIPMA